MLDVKVNQKYLDRIGELKSVTDGKQLKSLLSDGYPESFCFDVDEGIVISYKLFGIEQEFKYSFKEISRFTLIYDGYIIVFKDKGFIFVPVGEDSEYNEELIFLGSTVKEKIMAWRFEKKSRLFIPQKDKKYRKVDIDSLDIYKTNIGVYKSILMLVGVIIVLIVAGYLISMPYMYKPISINDAKIYNGEFDYCEYNEIDEFLTLYLKDKSSYDLHTSCGVHKIAAKLDKLKKGDNITVAINPKHDCMIELKTGSDVILDIDYAQKCMKEDAVRYFWLGIVIVGGAVFLFVCSIRFTVKENKIMNKLKEKDF